MRIEVSSSRWGRIIHINRMLRLVGRGSRQKAEKGRLIEWGPAGEGKEGTQS